MSAPALDATDIRRVVSAALEEDLGAAGDVTSAAVVDAASRGRGTLVARERLVVAGLPVAREVFTALDPRCEFRALAAEGSEATGGEALASVTGSSRALLAGERAALNLLQRLCGVATASRTAVAEVAGTGAVVLDTRKTTPGLRRLEKYAVAVGGATNHRVGLYDAVMIKDTHLAVAGSIAEAVRRALAAGHPPERITVEVRSLPELAEAVVAGAGRALLDNMDLATLRAAVASARGRIVLEASGGLRPGRLRAVAETGVDCLSVGWITHSAPAADLAMDLEALP